MILTSARGLQPSCLARTLSCSLTLHMNRIGPASCCEVLQGTRCGHAQEQRPWPVLCCAPAASSWQCCLRPSTMPGCSVSLHSSMNTLSCMMMLMYTTNSGSIQEQCVRVHRCDLGVAMSCSCTHIRLFAQRHLHLRFQPAAKWHDCRQGDLVCKSLSKHLQHNSASMTAATTAAGRSSQPRNYQGS